MCSVRFATIALLFVVLFVSAFCAADEDEGEPTKKHKEKVTKLQIGIKKRVEDCTIKSRKGDSLHMHYTGSLYDDGEIFDSSLPRGTPFTFTLGTGQVIKGWDQGLLNMCEGEKRRLVIPSDLGYGESGSPPKIPPGATLVFEVEVIKIDRKDTREL